MILPFLLPTEGVRASVEIPLKNIPHIITPPRPSYPGLALAWARPATAAARDGLADVGPPGLERAQAALGVVAIKGRFGG